MLKYAFVLAMALACETQAAFVANNNDYVEAAVSNVNLDQYTDWWLHGSNDVTDTFARKLDGGIALVGQGGGSVLVQNRTDHTYLWSSGSGSVDNPSAPLAYAPDDYRRREYDIGLLGGAATLDFSKGVYYSVEVAAGNTATNQVTVFGQARRNDEIYLQAVLLDSTRTVTNAVLSPQLLGSQQDGAPNATMYFTFSYQADDPSDVLLFSIAGYNNAASTDRSLSLDAVGVGPAGEIEQVVKDAFIRSNVSYQQVAKSDVDLDAADDWWIHGDSELVDAFSKKVGSGISLAAQGGGVVLSQNRAAHTYVWADGSGTTNNPAAPASYDPIDYRRREYGIGLLGGASALDLTKGAYYSVDVALANAKTNRVTVYGTARRNDEIYVEACLLDSTKSLTNVVLAPVLMTTQADGQTTEEVSFSFSLDFHAETAGDVLSLTFAGYNDAETVDRSLGLDAVTVQEVLPAPPKIPNTTIPNVIIILTDDHGFTDFGIHGIDPNVQTPVLDSLAAAGALMKHGYATAPQCVPSRAGLMSGRIQNTFGTRQNGSIWGANPLPLDVPTIAERLVDLGVYTTGVVGKWHLEPPSDAVEGTDYPGVKEDYEPEVRGFQEFWRNSNNPYVANYDLAGNSLSPKQTIDDARNRVIVQGEAAEAFIDRNVDKPFFLYLSLFGPHWPRMSKSDPYYLNFPVLDYPQYNDEMDDIRRLGLGLVHAIDDSVAGVMQKLRDLGIEENTLILFSGDNGAQPKFFNGIGNKATIDAWTGNENIPLRGEKGSLWEGGIKVPMFAYWKGHITPGQVIEEPVWTLDFTATALKLAGGTIPSEFDGVDILPRLTGETNVLVRSKPMFWDWGAEIAMRKGEWKFLRGGSRKNLFNLARDPMELYDVKAEYPEKFAELEAEMMAWYNALPPEGRSPLNGDGSDFYLTGAVGYMADPRYKPSFTDGTAAAYPAPLQYGIPSYNSDGDAYSDWEEMVAGTAINNSNDVWTVGSTSVGANGSYVLTIDGKAGRYYTLWCSTNLVSSTWEPVEVVGPVPSDAPVSLSHSNNSPSAFYRLDVSE